MAAPPPPVPVSEPTQAIATPNTTNPQTKPNRRQLELAAEQEAHHQQRDLGEHRESFRSLDWQEFKASGADRKAELEQQRDPRQLGMPTNRVGDQSTQQQGTGGD
ncbi:MAG: hypothetical protein ACI9VR_002673 [Cognaticolwellia sp.]|jgi:hypothetical protein